MTLFIKIFRFYYEGFSNMTIGKKLWIIIIIKLFFIFAVFKLFFFKDPNAGYKTEKERGTMEIEHLTSKP